MCTSSGGSWQLTQSGVEPACAGQQLYGWGRQLSAEMAQAMQVPAQVADMATNLCLPLELPPRTRVVKLAAGWAHSGMVTGELSFLAARETHVLCEQDAFTYSYTYTCTIVIVSNARHSRLFWYHISNTR